MPGLQVCRGVHVRNMVTRFGANDITASIPQFTVLPQFPTLCNDGDAMLSSYSSTEVRYQKSSSEDVLYIRPLWVEKYKPGRLFERALANLEQLRAGAKRLGFHSHELCVSPRPEPQLSWKETFPRKGKMSRVHCSVLVDLRLDACSCYISRLSLNWSSTSSFFLVHVMLRGDRNCPVDSKTGNVTMWPNLSTLFSTIKFSQCCWIVHPMVVYSLMASLAEVISSCTWIQAMVRNRFVTVAYSSVSRLNSSSFPPCLVKRERSTDLWSLDTTGFNH